MADPPAPPVPDAADELEPADAQQGPAPEGRDTRRTFVKRLVTYAAATAVVGSAGIAATLRASGYRVDPKRAAKLKALASWELAVVDAVANRICAIDVPLDDPHAPPNVWEAEVAEFVDEFVHGAEPTAKRELHALIGGIEHVWPLFCGERRRFTALDWDRQDSVLSALESSRYGLARGAFHGLKSLCFMGYYRDPRTWGILGYDGPLVARPAAGWVPARYVPAGARAGGAP